MKFTQRGLNLDQTKQEYPPLTFGELGELLTRHVENVAVANIIKDALQRPLMETANPET